MTAPVAAPARKTVYIVQVLRGIAAAAVAVYHTHLILAKPEYGGVAVFGSVAGYGWLGVNFFFVLSGFIILLAHFRDIGQPARAGPYAWRRFVRVYPIYWIFTLAYMAAATVGLGSPSFGWDFPNLLSTFTLIVFDPEPQPPLQVAWTLFFEIIFYIAFLALIVNRRFGLVVFAAWPVAILVNALVLGRTNFGPFNMWNIYFLFGMGAYLAYRHAAGRWMMPMLAVGGVLLVALFALGLVPTRMVEAQHDPVLLLYLAGVFALLLASATLFERDRALRFPAPLLLLGDASYSVYLIHSPVLSAFATLKQKLAADLLPAWATFAVALIACLTAGVLAHLLIEKPVLRLVHLRVGRLNPPASAASRRGA
ncbi:acyltransferase family protein [Sphingomonas sp.]|uniref:acyltransferase family protein n=1 Tax=Sphingomonas sp. TaxID=28214 RepID=UPI0035C86CD0